MLTNDRIKEVQALIAQELALNGVHFDQEPWLNSDSVLEEVTHTLVAESHEGKIPSFGVLFAENPWKLENVRRLPLQPEQLALARRLANGIHSFVLYEREKFSGLVFFAEPVTSEVKLLRILPQCGGMIVQKSETGVTRFFKKDSITLHENRIWLNKPHVEEASSRISSCIAGINHTVLNRILESAFHSLSPAFRTGATLVWYLQDPTQEELHQLSAEQNLSPFRLSMLDERDSAAICHLLSQIDGATILDSTGNLIRTGVHLKYSAKSNDLVPEHKGTRHTSAKRFSYDHPNTLVITISEDGWVTVFSDGASLVDLKVSHSKQVGKLLEKMEPGKKEGVSHTSIEVLCNHCGKSSMVEEVKVVGEEELHEVNCPVCLSPIYSSRCFALEAHSFKRLSSSQMRFRDRAKKLIMPHL